MTINGIRTYCYALLLTEAPGIFGGTERQVRGFGTDPAWPVFDLYIPSIDYQLTDASGNAIFMSNSHPEGRPLFTGGILQIAGGPRLDLISCNGNQSIDVQTFEGRYGERVILKVWEKLPGKVAKYWTAPHMPTLSWGPPRRW